MLRDGERPLRFVVLVRNSLACADFSAEWKNNDRASYSLGDPSSYERSVVYSRVCSVRGSSLFRTAAGRC